MAVIKASDSAGLPDLEMGVYQAVVDEVKETTGKSFNDPTKEVPRLEIVFRLPEEDNVTVRQWATLYETLTPKQGLYPIVSSILYAGQPIPVDDEIDTDELVGKACQIVWGTYVKSDKSQGVGITQVLPPRKRGKSAMSAEDQAAKAKEVESF